MGIDWTVYQLRYRAPDPLPRACQRAVFTRASGRGMTNLTQAGLQA